MTPTSSASSPSSNSPVAAAWPWRVLWMVILLAVAARAGMHFSTPLVPGMNGGYYLVQARSLLTTGMIGIPDLPLTFTVQAALSKVVQWVTGRDLEPSIVLAVKMADAALPPLVALPVFLLGRAWCRRAGRGAWLSVAAASVVALGAPALSMVGDFQKNSLGLAWLAGLAYALYAWKTHRTIGCGVAVLVLLGLTGLTHIGVFGAALLLTASVFVAGVVLPRNEPGGERRRVNWLLVAGGAGVAALAAGIVLWKFDPARIHRLVGAFSNPATFLKGHGPPMRLPATGDRAGFPNGGSPPGGDMGFGPPPEGGARSGPPQGNNTRQGPTPGGFMPGRGPGPGMGPGMGFGPMAMMLPSWAAPALFGGLALSALILALWKRRTLPPAESAIGMGCAATTLLLTGPWVQGDVAMRFYLNAMIPATITGLFVLVQIPNRWVCGVLGGVFVLLAVGPAVPLAARGGRPIISEAAFRELQSLAPRLANPQRTLVVTRHGVEWWSAWTLHTRVAQTKAVRAEDWQKYDEVYFLQSKERGGPGFGPPGGGMNRRPFPPDGFAGGPPPGDLPPFARNARGMGAGNRPPMMDSVIPEGAEVLHDGTFFKLAKVKQPPSFVRRNRTGETDDDRP